MVKYVSVQLLEELPKPLINFLWYLWEVYCDPTADESTLLLQPGGSGQRVTILPIEKTVEQNFNTVIDATLLIQKRGPDYRMSRK